MPIIIPANSAASGGYDVDNSVRLNGTSSYLQKTPSSAGNVRTWTFSTWFKKSKQSSSAQQKIFSVAGGGSNNFECYFNTNDTLAFYQYTSGGTNAFLGTNQVFRDTAAWYHLVLAVDTTQGTASNRIKMYVNGEQVTSFSTAIYFNQNFDTFVDSTGQHRIGANLNTSQYFDGYLAETVLIDGQQLAQTDFGEFDGDSGIWKPKDVSSLTPGTNGFYLDFKESSNLGNDSFGGTDLTEANLAAIDQSTDTCTNNFSTWNPLLAMNSTMVITEGNLSGKTATNYANGASNCWFSTIGVSSGKWYAEFKQSAGTNNQGQQLGIGYDLSKFQRGSAVNAFNLGYIAEGWGYLGSEGRVVNNNGTVISSLATWTIGDIIGIALDMDNYKLYFSKNGSFQNSGDPTSGATGTGAISLTTGKTYFFGCSDASLSNTYTFQANFGSPSFSISSGNQDGNDRGNFEYAVPSGYLAVCTKNLSEANS